MDRHDFLKSSILAGGAFSLGINSEARPLFENDAEAVYFSIKTYLEVAVNQRGEVFKGGG